MNKIAKIGLEIACIMIVLVGTAGCRTIGSFSSSPTIPTSKSTPSLTTPPTHNPTPKPTPVPTVTAAPVPSVKLIPTPTARPTPALLIGKIYNTPTPFEGDVNGSANLAKDGFAAIQDGWIYFANDCGLYKMKANGTNKVKMCDIPTRPDKIDYLGEINVTGDWVYFSDYHKGIYRIKTDGTGKKKIWTGYVEKVNVVGNQIYFTAIDKKRSSEGSPVWTLCKLDIRKNKMQVLCDIPIDYNMYIANGWIYFSETLSYEREIYKMRTDGTKLQLALADEVYDFTVAGNWIFYLVGTKKDDIYKIYKVKTDGTGRQKIAEDIKMDAYSGLSVAGDWIYYLDAINIEDNLYNLCKININGTGQNKIAKKISVVYLINVAGEWIFYESYEDHELYRIKTDGTKKEMI